MRILHTMLRVGDLQRSIDFYTQVIGMRLLRTSDNPEYQYKLAFLGFGNNPKHAEHAGVEVDRALQVANAQHGVQDSHGVSAMDSW